MHSVHRPRLYRHWSAAAVHPDAPLPKQALHWKIEDFGLQVNVGPIGRGGGPILGLLKKAASGVLAIFSCSRTKRTLRA
ncbi:MAG: hypothetical protein R3B95_10740 [Nitrospirales bacterium]|nr:hypothetical protein [Nitrospirales bacterium]